MRMRLENIIQEWCNEAGKPVSIARDRHALDNTLRLYTQYPGLFIGVRGTLIEKYKKILKELHYEKVEIIELKETFTPGNDCSSIVEERVRAFFETETM